MSTRNSFGGVLQQLRQFDWTPGAVIDIGVGEGTPGLYGLWPQAPLVLVEPAPESGKYLDEIAATLPDVRVYRVGASDHAGIMTARVDPSGVYANLGDHKRKWAQIEVPVMRCDDIIADAGLRGPFFYKLDTDAHEVEILKGSTETLKQTDFVFVEMNFMHPIIGLAGPNDIWRILADHGFTLLDATPMHYSAEGIARTADFLFVRQDSEVYRQAFAKSGKAAKPPRGEGKARF